MLKSVKVTLVFRPFHLLSFPELTQALVHMRSRRSGDDAGLVLEMFKLGCAELHECLLDIYNRMLVEDSLEPSWQHTFFQDVTQTR